MLPVTLLAESTTALPAIVRFVDWMQTPPSAESTRNWGIWVILLVIGIIILWWLLQGEGQEPSNRTNPNIVVTPPTTPNAPVRVTVTTTAPVAVADDLTKIEGIGPKIKSVLHDAGIKTFADLAQADVANLRQILANAGLRVNDPATWPEQAALAAAGQWAELQQLQARLNAGRRA